MTFLLDCSHYQGTINWTQVKADGCVGAYIKTTDGVSGVDAMWQANHAGARGVGLPVGPYHFAEGGNVSAEAAHFASIWSAGWELHPTLDYEIASANAGWLTAFRTFFRQDSGFEPFRLYSSVSLLNGPLNPSGWLDALSTIWAAEYAAALAFHNSATVLWQNTSTAKVPGILGNVDEDQWQNGWTPAADQGATMTNPFTANSAAAPILNPTDGSYSGTDASTPTDFADFDRFTNASVRWLIEQWVPKMNAQIAEIQTAVAALGTPATELTGTASVTVDLAPKTA